MSCTFEYPPEIAALKFLLPCRCGFCSVNVATCSSKPYVVCSVSVSSDPRRLILDTSSETRGLTPGLPSGDSWLQGKVSPSWMHDASEIVPAWGVPSAASKPNP